MQGQPTSYHRWDVEAVERDLSLLAHQKHGFERPEKLMNELRAVLSFSVVERVAGRMHDSTAARLEAFRSVLRLAVEQMTGEDTKIKASLYFFLLTAAELEALELSPNLAQAALGERRQAIADMFETSPGAYRNGEEQRIRALVAGELLRYELEARNQGGYSPHAASIPDSGSEDVDTNAATLAIGKTLARHYDNDEGLLSLASFLIPDRPIYKDANIHLTISDDPDNAANYCYNLTITFSAELSEYVVGYVTQSHLTEAILVDAQRVTDVYSFSTDEARDQCYHDMCDSLDVVTLIATRSDGRTRHSHRRLERVSSQEYADFLSEDHLMHRDAVKFLRADLNSNGVVTRMKVRQTFTLPKSDHFCYWVADRPIYLRHLRVDAREFTPPKSSRNSRLTLQPFMMATNLELTLGRDHTLDLETENWLVRGQGFAIVW